LRGVEDVCEEFPYATAFKKDYRFDLALLGRKIHSKRIVLGAIEIENSCRFDIEKAIVCKSLGFPLISIDVTEIQEEDLTLEWAVDVLMQTRNNEEKRRRNYYYVHLALYPIFLDDKFMMNKSKDKHQYVVFANDNDLESIERNIKILSNCLGMNDDVTLGVTNNKNSQTEVILRNHGNIAGPDWDKYNENKCLLITIKRDFNTNDLNYYFHLTLARILNAHYDTLVGYKPYKGARDFSELRVWKEACVLNE